MKLWLIRRLNRKHDLILNTPYGQVVPTKWRKLNGCFKIRPELKPSHMHIDLHESPLRKRSERTKSNGPRSIRNSVATTDVFAREDFDRQRFPSNARLIHSLVINANNAAHRYVTSLEAHFGHEWLRWS